MEIKEQRDFNEVKIPKILNIMCLLSYLAWPVFYASSYISLQFNITVWIFWILIFFPVIPIVYAIIKKIFRIKLIFPLIFNFLIFIITLLGFIQLEGSNDGAAVKDARIKADIEQFGEVAKEYKAEKGSYGAALSLSGCAVADFSLIAKNSEGLALCEDIQALGSGDFILNVNSTGTAYCVQKVLPGGSTWCLDRDGFNSCIGGINCSEIKGCDAIDYSCL